MRIVFAVCLLLAGLIGAYASFRDGPRWMATAIQHPESDGRLHDFAAIGEATTPAVAPEPGAFEASMTTTAHLAEPAPRASDAEPAAADAGWQTYAVNATTPTDPATRAALARDIQIELARLGCYRGTANGQWSAATQHAAGLLISEANAKMQVQEPDFVLLSLAKSAGSELACGPAYEIARQDLAAPAMGLGGPTEENRSEQATQMPVAHRAEREVQSLFTNPLGR